MGSGGYWGVLFIVRRIDVGKIAKDDEVLLELGLSTTVTPAERAVVLTAINYAEGAVRRYLRYDPAWLSRTEFYPVMDFNQRNVDTSDAVWESSETEAYLRRLSSAATNQLQVRHLPIRSMTSLRVDYDGRFGTRVGSFAVATEKTEGEDYWPNYDSVDSDGNGVCMDGIIKSIGGWPTTPGSVRITYVAGYTDEEFHGRESVIDATPIWSAVMGEAVRKAKSIFVNQKQSGTGFVGGVIISEKLGDYSYTIDASQAKMLFGSSWDLTGQTKEMLSEFVNWGWMLAS